MGQTFSEPVTEKESTIRQDETYLVASSSIQGWRISMEDAHTIMLTMPDDPKAAFFAVFDGHGGAKVANYAAENLHKGLCNHHLYQEGHIEEALKTVFLEFDEMMFNDEKMRDELAGSTAVCVLIKNDKIYCANIGDSRSVACFAGQVDPLSYDHKPTCPTESNRIIQAGGWVQFNRVNGNLALSRAFGDFVFKRNERRSATEQIVVAYPDVQKRPMTQDLEFIVLACDGVWDVMTNEEVVEFIRRRIIYRMDPVAICEELITRCLAPDCQMGSGIGCDNMTVIVICYLNGATFDEYCDRVAHNCPLGIPPPPSGMDEELKLFGAHLKTSGAGLDLDGASVVSGTEMSHGGDDSDNSSDTSSSCSYEDIFPTNTTTLDECSGGHNSTTMAHTCHINADSSVPPPPPAPKVTATHKETDALGDGYGGSYSGDAVHHHSRHHSHHSNSHHLHLMHHHHHCPQHGSSQSLSPVSAKATSPMSPSSAKATVSTGTTIEENLLDH